MRSSIALSCLALVLFPAWAHADAPRVIAGPVEARVVKVRDGDTVEVEAYVWPMQSVTVAVRLRSVDAPELKAKCPSERKGAVAARERFRTLIGEGPLYLTRIPGDKYFGRVLADLGTKQVRDIGAVMLREGLVDAYDGGRRRDWCTITSATRDSAPEPDGEPEAEAASEPAKPTPAPRGLPGLFWRR